MTRYETPAFEPGIAFSWTLRSAEIARRRRDEARVSEPAAGYGTPAFEPGVAFSWTLRSGEIARRQSRRPLNAWRDRTQLNVLVAA
jgi:hypothetical protein